MPRTFITVLDQGVVSLSSFAVVLLAARILSVDEFGQLAIAMVTASVTLAATRGLLNESFLTGSGALVPSRPGALLGLQMAGIGAGLAAVVVLLQFVILGSYVMSSLMLACYVVSLPALVGVDVLRTVAVAWGRPGLGLAADGSALVLFLGWSLVGPASNLANVAVGWLLASIAAVVILLALLLRHGRGAGANRPIKDLLSKGLPGSAENLLVNIGTLLSYAVAGAVAGPQAVAGARAAGTLFGPLTVLGAAAVQMLGPDIVRHGAAARRRILLVQVALVAATIVTTAVCWVLPTSVGVMILGDVWTPARAAVVPIGVFTALVLVGMQAVLEVRLTGHAKQLVRVRGPLVVVGPLMCLALVSYDRSLFPHALAALALVDMLICIAVLRRFRARPRF